MIEVREYTDPHGRSPFQQWVEDLDARAAATVTVALTRLEQGDVSNVKGVGGGVLELRIDYGPGYRIDFRKDGEHVVILLGGGTKKRSTETSGPHRISGQHTKPRRNRSVEDASDTGFQGNRQSTRRKR